MKHKNAKSLVAVLVCTGLLNVQHFRVVTITTKEHLRT